MAASKLLGRSLTPLHGTLFRPIPESISSRQDLKCLIDDVGMKSACIADLQASGAPVFPFTHWIYNTSLPVFLRAFASEDAAQGGCPAI